ncbi:hypothetical protein HAHE_15980 [Haloferula helveola]|uniref:Uncharacterized protein n=1 Tax=Haloferula helveola TaxID=490095 RepID=A0ABM7RCB8_9BACT|nr:hypothetical protein HAHE_15980 [Haloferula helveola]
MKHLLTLLTVIGAGFVAAPDAEARPHQHNSCSTTYVSGHTSCGCPIYTQRYVAYYDRFGRAIYRYQTLPVNHHCRHRVVRQPQCHTPQPRYQNSRYTRSGVRIGPVIVGGGSRYVPSRSCR